MMPFLFRSCFCDAAIVTDVWWKEFALLGDIKIICAYFLHDLNFWRK